MANQKIINLLHDGMKQVDVAKECNVTPNTVKGIARRMRVGELKPTTKKHNPTDERVMRLEQEVLMLKDENRLQQKVVKEYRKKAALFEAVMGEVKEICTPLVFQPKKIIIPKKKHTVEEDLVLHLSDEHMDESVLPHQVQGLEEYTFPIAMRRAENFVDRTLKFTQQTLSNYKFKNLWILAYGDHTSGEIHDSVSRSYFQNQFRNCFAIGQVHAFMINDLAPYFENVKVVYIAGNHGRRSAKKDYHGAWNNWDYMVGETAKLLCQNMKNVEFLIPDAFNINININGFNFAIEHGDDIKSWNSIPFYGLERKSRRLIALNAMQGRQIHYTVYGHFHKPSTFGDIGDTETIINGTWKATDPYGLGNFSGFVEPSQWIHGVHVENGLSWRLKLRLRSDDEKQGPQRYKINLATADHHTQ